MTLYPQKMEDFEPKDLFVYVCPQSLSFIYEIGMFNKKFIFSSKVLNEPQKKFTATNCPLLFPQLVYNTFRCA